MLIDIDLTRITLQDHVVLANNRQVLAFQKTWQKTHGISAMASAMSWKNYVYKTWLAINQNTNIRFIDEIEAKYLINQSILEFKQETDSELINQVFKNYCYCANYNIPITELKNTKINLYENFAKWITNYQIKKTKLNLVDANDLSAIILKNYQKNIAAPYVYGFKTYTPEQQALFSTIGYKQLQAKKTSNHINTKTFNNNTQEILSCAKWAHTILQHNPSQQIAIVVPELDKHRHQIDTIFNQIFHDTLVETKQKIYNISLGKKLVEYPIIANIILLLKLSSQIKQNKINSEDFNLAISSPYIAGAASEKYNRALLVNKILALSQQNINYQTLQKKLTNVPILAKIITNLHATGENKYQQTHDKWLEYFNKILHIWGFASEKYLSSAEFQLLRKYQQILLYFNRISTYKVKINANNALQALQQLVNQVIFQAKSAKNTKIHILGALEAEGLRFDYAWIMGMNNNFLPSNISAPKFIPYAICKKYKLTNSDYKLSQIEDKKTIEELKLLANNIIFSYATSDADDKHNKQASTLIKFNNPVEEVKYQQQEVKYHLINDNKAPKLLNTQVNSGVTTITAQMACEFKGFAQRLNIIDYKPAHFGFARFEQGQILHQALANIYSEINNKNALLKHNDDSLNQLINLSIKKAMAPYPQSSAIKENEQQHLLVIINNFIVIEKQRDDFAVVAVEQQQQVNIANLSFTIRIDRIDDINNNKIIFDYKTSKSSINNWLGEVIKQPQLPIYACTNNADAIAFIEFEQGNIRYKGIAKNDNDLINVKNTKIDFDEQRTSWQKKITKASVDFQRGNAKVSPNQGACDYCQYAPLCRIKTAI